MLKHQGRVTHPPLGLVGTGPLVQVTLRPHPGEAARMLAEGQEVPAVVTKMMIDTGAQRTVVDNQIALQLGLVPIRFDSIVGVSQKPENRPVYRMSVSLVMSDSETVLPTTS